MTSRDAAGISAARCGGTRRVVLSVVTADHHQELPMLATCPHCCAEVKVPTGVENAECPRCHILFQADGSLPPVAPPGNLPATKALLVASGIVAALAMCLGIPTLLLAILWQHPNAPATVASDKSSIPKATSVATLPPPTLPVPSPTKSSPTVLE